MERLHLRPSVAALAILLAIPGGTAVRTSAADRNVVAIFTAIADFDNESLRLALNRCADPDAGFPDGEEADALRKRCSGGPAGYYLLKEPGYTPLMFASAIGNETAVRFLLLAGASPSKRSAKSRTFALWQAARNGHIAIMKRLMGVTEGSDSEKYRIEIDLAKQQAVVWHERKIVFVTPISSGKASAPTRRGDYLVTDKYCDWRSTLYDARMPYFLRLSCGDFGLHAGDLPGYPASHGCVRLPEDNAKQLYSMIPLGTLVEIR